MDVQSNTKPWQAERARILQRICQRIKSREDNGQGRLRAVRIFSRRWNAKPLKCAPRRRLALSRKTLYRLYAAWRRTGETPMAFQLNYSPGNRRIAAPVLLRFVRFIAIRDFKSARAAWKSFCARGGSFGPGRPKLGYDALLWNLPKGCCREIKASRQAKRAAETRLSQLKDRLTAEILAKTPAKLPRRAQGRPKTPPL